MRMTVLVLVLVFVYNTVALWWAPFYRQRPGLRATVLSAFIETVRFRSIRAKDCATRQLLIKILGKHKNLPSYATPSSKNRRCAVVKMVLHQSLSVLISCDRCPLSTSMQPILLQALYMSSSFTRKLYLHTITHNLVGICITMQLH